MPELSERNLPPALLRELPRLKRDYPHIYAVETKGGVFAVRPLTWREYKHAKERVQRTLLPEVSIVEVGLLWPDEIPDDAPAGVISTLSLAILDASGFENPMALQSAMAGAELDVMENPEHMLVMVICKAFPAYKPEDLEEMPFLDLILRFKQAEQMLGMDPARLVGPEEEPRRRPARSRQRPPMTEIGDQPMVYGNTEEFIPEPAEPPPGRTHDPLRDPNLPPPNFEADNRFFRKNFVDYLTKTPHPGEV